MDPILILEEAMKVLDVISEFINNESENYIECQEVRNPLENAFQKIYEIYEQHGDENIVEDLRDKWEKESKNH